jgi:hypothetical protein
MLNLLTESDVAERLQVSFSSVPRWRLEKRGPTFVKVGARVPLPVSCASMTGRNRCRWCPPRGEHRDHWGLLGTSGPFDIKTCLAAANCGDYGGFLYGERGANTIRAGSITRSDSRSRFSCRAEPRSPSRNDVQQNFERAITQ